MASRIEGYTQEEATTALADWKACVAGLATSQSYTIGQRTLTRVELPEAKKMVAFFAAIVDRFEGNRTARTRRAVPRDL